MAIVDLADLCRRRMLDPTRVVQTGKIPAIAWNAPGGLDKLGVFAEPMVRSFKGGSKSAWETVHPIRIRRHQTRRPARMVALSGVLQGCRVLYGEQLRCRKCAKGSPPLRSDNR